MSREPINPIPKGILAARTCINELASENKFKLVARNSLWTEAEILCHPLECKVSYSRESIELIFEIKIGKVFETSAIEELMEELPIPVNYSFSLEPEPELVVVNQMAVVPTTSKSEVMAFFKNSLLSALMTAQVCLVTDSLTAKSKSIFQKSSLPKGNSMWDFGSIIDSLLSDNG
jgi:hypothetical protein